VGFLSELVDRIRRELERHPLDDVSLMSRVAAMAPPRNFRAALEVGSAPGRPAVIAEFKRSSPSVGSIDAGADPSERARAYEAAGARAMSVLTEPRHFGGSLADLQAARSTCDLPLLRKDFLVHPSQLIEARASGADAALLITSALPSDELIAMIAACEDVGLAALVETHSPDDLERALDTKARIVGVNSRDLETLEMDEDRAIDQLSRIPADRVAVFESGIRSREQVQRASDAGARAVLVGEALMRAHDAAAKLRELLGEDPK
jgi:indole-3-glycerol phosphate synthase